MQYVFSLFEVVRSGTGAGVTTYRSVPAVNATLSVQTEVNNDRHVVGRHMEEMRVHNLLDEVNHLCARHVTSRRYSPGTRVTFRTATRNVWL